ncbi:unnamed protein product, partial [Mesorhabditis belari]|uniref:Lipoprotein n=1 Tax=Mesorhabditis belari TaxID=2138241 RepID=A0AAF3F175_9BILA
MFIRISVLLIFCFSLINCAKKKQYDHREVFGENCVENSHRPLLKAYREWVGEFQKYGWHPYYVHGNALNYAKAQTGITPPECFQLSNVDGNEVSE